VEKFGEEIEGLLHFLKSNDLEVGIASWHLTNYLVFLAIAIVVLLIVFFVARNMTALIPKGRFYNLIELLVEFVRNDIAVANIGPEGTRYFPFLGTVFFFILINNIIGTIPGGKPGTGTMGVTVALALVAFVMFNAAGMQKRGVGGYIKGIVPHGVPGVLWPVIWVIEVISLLVRPFTLSIRLFANMYAGHIVLGIFSILTSIAAEQIIAGLLHGAGAGSVAIGGISAIAWMLLLTALYILEIGVAILQAYIFTLLTTVYISLAVSEH
jgi:F-type H+-transporting ATPase subunit a